MSTCGDDCHGQALRSCANRELYPNHVYTNYTSLVELINREEQTVAWRYKQHILEIRRQINRCFSLQLEYISRDLNQMTDKLAKFALKNPAVSLFHKDLDLQPWLVETVANNGFKFQEGQCLQPVSWLFFSFLFLA